MASAVVGPDAVANAVTHGSRWWVAHCRARRATMALLRTSGLPAAAKTSPSSSVTRRARSASRSRRSITASNCASGPIGREAISRSSGWTDLMWATRAGTSACPWKASDSSSGTSTTSLTPRLASLPATASALGGQWSMKAIEMSSSGRI